MVEEDRAQRRRDGFVDRRGAPEGSFGARARRSSFSPGIVGPRETRHGRDTSLPAGVSQPERAHAEAVSQPLPRQHAYRLRLVQVLSTEKSPVVLAADDLVVDFKLGRRKHLRAVDHVSFELCAGQVLGVVGESGSGKSTLGRVAAGILHPTSGQVSFATGAGGLQPRQQERPRGYRDIQMIFQESAMALNPRLPVWRVVGEAVRPNMVTAPALGRSTIAELKRHVAEQLERAGLPAATFMDKRAAELSGGEKQRVAIARALAAAPIVMVCDESVSALDVSIRAVVLNLLQRLSKEEGIALVFITHDISVVAHLADQLAVMYHGKIVESGVPRDIIDDPRDEYTQRLIAAVPTLERALVPAFDRSEQC
jgi:peptide/nickel transport system ATP-binding protein